MLRIADDKSKDAVPGKLLTEFILDGQSVVGDEILLDAWTSAASTNPIPTLVGLINSGNVQVNNNVTARIAVLAEHIARSNPTAEKSLSLLDLDPNSKLTVAAWEGLARGWPKDLTLTLSDEAQKKFRERYLVDSTSIEVKAALLSVADKWSIRDLDQSVAAIQGSLFDVALRQCSRK